MEEAISKYLINLGIPGIILIGLFMLAKLWFPKLLDRFDAQLNAERKQCKENHDIVCVSMLKNHETTMAALFTNHEKNMEAHSGTQNKIVMLAQEAKLQQAISEAKRV